MKCVAIGDMMIPTRYFKEELEKNSFISEFSCRPWKEDLNKDEFREVIRKIETEGPGAYDPGAEITNLMKEAEKNPAVLDHPQLKKLTEDDNPVLMVVYMK